MSWTKNRRRAWLPVSMLLIMQGCSLAPPRDPATVDGAATIEASLPAAFPGGDVGDTASVLPWRDFFADEALRNLITDALANNQEQQLLLAELEIARNEAVARSGEYLPSASLRAGAGRDKVGEYTREGAVEEQLPFREEQPFPDPLPDYLLGIDVSWELDIWHRLRDAQKSAVLRYLATAEGQRFAQTHLVSEIGRSYYELVALDRKQGIIHQMISLQESALKTVTLQKQAGDASELAVRRFEAELQRNRAGLFELRQQIREVENRINFLAGRFPTPVDRGAAQLSPEVVGALGSGSPAELLARRPDIHGAELSLAAAELDINVARMRFYPSIDLDASVGFHAAESGLVFNSPESLAYGFAANLAMPLLNRRGIEAAYNSANALQRQALTRYGQVVLNAYAEVSTQLSMLENLQSSIDFKRQQTDALTESVNIANRLYRSARADYTEVLLTQRDALESQMELVELQERQLSAMIEMYELLGGGTESEVPQAG